MDKLTDADKDHEDRRPGDRTRNPVKPGNLLDPDRQGRVRRIGIRIARGYLRHTNAPLSRWPRMRSTSAPKRGVVIMSSVRGRGRRAEERRVGKECGSTCRSGGSL